MRLSDISYSCFNPRSREGSDDTDTYINDIEMVSIHAPVKGATIFRNAYMPTLWGFNPRSREGSDYSSVSLKLYLCVSIHAPVKGATFKMRNIEIFNKFQSTLP